jgi:CHAD domain-containing protein
MSKRNKHSFPLLDYLDSLVENLRNLVSSAVAGEDVDAVHDARVATRRLKAATLLVDEIVSNRYSRPFNRVGKCLRRQLGPLRDLDVMIEHLSEIKIPRYRAAIQWLSARFTEARQQTVQSASDNAPPAKMLARLGSWWGLRHEIESSPDSIGELLAKSVHLQLDAFVEQAEDLIGPRRSDPHQLRIAGKSLRYTLEMAREHGVKLSASVVRLFKRMQGALGLWHDYVVLAERILRESVECDLALHDPRLQSELLNVAQLYLKKSDSQLKKMATLWQTRGESLAQTIRQAFPLTQRSEPTTEPEHEPSTQAEQPSPEPQSAPAA